MPKRSSPPAAKLGRPRDPEADRAILTAALKLIDDRGYAGFSIDEIARRTAISKATIYRRWKSSGELLLDALLQYGVQAQPPQVGRLETDLAVYFKTIFAALNTRIGEAVRSLMAEAQANDSFRALFRERFIAARRKPVRDLLENAQARGELSASVDLEFLLDLLFGALWYRLLVEHAPLDPKLAARFVDLVNRYRP